MWSTLSSYSEYQAKVAAVGNASKVIIATGPAEDDPSKNLMMLRVLRAVRMVKLVRLVRASKIYERWQARVSLSFAALTVIKCVGGIFLVTHCTHAGSRASLSLQNLIAHRKWRAAPLLCRSHDLHASLPRTNCILAGFACIIALQTTLHTYAQETWLARFGYCGEDDPTLTVAECTGPNGIDLTSWYLGCTTWSLLLITGHGPGEYPFPYSVAENVTISMLQLASALMWTVILAAFCDIATNANPEAILFRQTSMLSA